MVLCPASERPQARMEPSLSRAREWERPHVTESTERAEIGEIGDTSKIKAEIKSTMTGNRMVK
jgi:hypothetical protein